jgi:hypothetical protein
MVRVSVGVGEVCAGFRVSEGVSESKYQNLIADHMLRRRLRILPIDAEQRPSPNQVERVLRISRRPLC